MKIKIVDDNETYTFNKNGFYLSVYLGSLLILGLTNILLQSNTNEMNQSIAPLICVGN